MGNSQEEASKDAPNTDLDETVAYGEELPLELEVAREEEEPEWNRELLFQEGGDEKPWGG